jgi:hypothetical protein
MDQKLKLDAPLLTEEGLEIVEIVTEENDIYALIKVRVVDLPNLKFLRTNKKRRDYQKDVQRKYRKKKKDREGRRDRDKRRRRRDREEIEDPEVSNSSPDESTSTF